jgi:hypothetical protein
MKKILFAFLTAGMFVFSSCADECKDVTCENGGTCNEGVCECPAGYVGDLCETKENEKFVGSWKYNESCDEAVVTDFPVAITEASSSPSKIAISGFGGFQCSVANIIVEATVTGNDISLSSNQSFCSGGLTINSGTGSLNASGKSISFTYSYTFNGTTGNCSGTYTKI